MTGGHLGCLAFKAYYQCNAPGPPTPRVVQTARAFSLGEGTKGRGKQSGPGTLSPVLIALLGRLEAAVVRGEVAGQAGARVAEQRASSA